MDPKDVALFCMDKKVEFLTNKMLQTIQNLVSRFAFGCRSQKLLKSKKRSKFTWPILECAECWFIYVRKSFKYSFSISESGKKLSPKIWTYTTPCTFLSVTDYNDIEAKSLIKSEIL